MNVKEMERIYLETLKENRKLTGRLLQYAPIIHKNYPELYFEIQRDEQYFDEVEYLKSVIKEKDIEIANLKSKLNKNIKIEIKTMEYNYKPKKQKKKKQLVNYKEYQEFRKRVLERDNYTCQECGSTNRLQVHHIKSKYEFPELICDMNNCITLCISCHSKTDNFFTSKRG